MRKHRIEVSNTEFIRFKSDKCPFIVMYDWRKYAVGDSLMLIEVYSANRQLTTGREVRCEITHKHVTSYGPTVAILGLRYPHEYDGDRIWLAGVALGLITGLALSLLMQWIHL